MSANFSFPPPPPPPPKARHNHENNSGEDRNQDGQRGRGFSHASQGLNRGNWRGIQASRPTQRGGRGGRPHRNQHYDSNPRQGASHHSPQGGFRSSLPTKPPTLADSQQNHPGPQPHSRVAGFDRSAAGHKRKLEALRDADVKPSPSPYAPPVAPAVPSFGFSIIPTPTRTPSQTTASTKPSNYLGLTPANVDDISTFPDENDDDASGPEEDVDEEALYAELGSKLTFEHNGEVITLKSAADITQWIDQRKRNWPTEKRKSEKAAIREQVGLERRRLLDDASRILRTGVVRPQRADKIAKQPSNPSALTSDTDEDEGSDDDPPEEIQNEQSIDRNKPGQICRFLYTSGGCYDGATCRFSHDGYVPIAMAQKPEKSPKDTKSTNKPIDRNQNRNMLYDALLEQQHKEEDRLALKVIKALGQAGFFRSHED